MKIIYLDIDGTLRDEREGIPQSAFWAIRQCQERNIKIVVCTGRSPGMIQDDVKELKADGMISGGGCYIQYHGKELWRGKFPRETLQKALALASGWHLAVAVETERQVYMNHGAAVFYRNDFQHKASRKEKGVREQLAVQNKISYEDNLESLQEDVRNAHKICVFGGKVPVDRMEKALKKESSLAQKREWNGSWYLELLPRGCDKGKAVRKLNRSLGIPKKKTMSFGDGENDIAMMKATGIAVAVGDVGLSIRKYASSVCEPVMEDGIYKELVRRNVILCQEEKDL